MKLFFAWQSERNETKKFIRNLLQEICDDLNVEYDEDSRNSGGADFVVDVIERKIRNSSVFVGDITPIGENIKGKKISNSNVCFETGYAERHLGRDRIILLVNSDHGDYKDLPFDFGKRVATKFSLEKVNRKSLKSKLKRDINQILEVAKRKENKTDLNKYEKALMYWCNKFDGIHRKSNKRLSPGGRLFMSSNDYYFYKRYDTKTSARYNKALNDLVSKELLLSDEFISVSFLGSPEPNSYVLSEEGEILAGDLERDEVFGLVQKDQDTT